MNKPTDSQYFWCRNAACVLLAVLMGVMAIGTSESDSEDGSGAGASERRDSHDQISAWTMTKVFVKRNLKAPSTADFGGLFSDYQDPTEIVTHLGDGRYVVVGWVDAENAFGAKLRNRFVCEIQYDGNDQWRLINLVFE